MNTHALRRLALAPALLFPTLAVLAEPAPGAKPAEKPADKPAATTAEKPANAPAAPEAKPAAASTPAAAKKRRFNAPPKPPVLGYLYPAGARIGESAELTVGGGHLYGATAALVSGRGVTAVIVDSRDPEEGLDEFQRKRKPRKAGQTLLDETVTVRVTVAPDAEPGERELCLLAPGGISNRRVLHVGRLPEILEKEPNNSPEKAELLATLPVTINGRLLQGDEDCFVFRARRGQTIVAEVAARALIPYIADAVPGWFQATVAIFDATGREVAYADDFRFNPDPVLFFNVPADGEYRLLVRDALSRGREDFVYRVRLGELPFVTGIRPLGGTRSDRPTLVTLAGKNLPKTGATLDTSRTLPGTTLPVSVSLPGVESNRLPFAVDDLPEIAESSLRAPAPGHPPYLRTPGILNGTISKPGKKDRFALYAKAGETFDLEVFARRLGSPLDSKLTLTGPDGSVLAQNDDHKDPTEGLLTHQADSGLTFTFPQEGTYVVQIEDTQGKGGEDFRYRLRIDTPHPDFAASAAPASVVVAPGGVARLSVNLLRRNGFKGAVRVVAESGPDAPAISGALIPAGADKATLTLALPDGAKPGMHVIRLNGVGEAAPGVAVNHPVRASEDAMQAFIYHHPVPCHDILVAVPAKPAAFSVRAAPGAPEFLQRGRTTTIPLKIRRDAEHPEEIRLQIAEAPKGVGIFKGAVIPKDADTAELVLRTAADASPGNLLLNAVMELPVPEESDAKPGPDGKPPKPRKNRVTLALPAIPVPPKDESPEKK